MAKARDDDSGWKRGAGVYSRNYAKPDRPEDSTTIKSMAAKLESDNSPSGPVSRGGPPRFKPKTAPIGGKMSDAYMGSKYSR